MLLFWTKPYTHTASLSKKQQLSPKLNVVELDELLEALILSLSGFLSLCEELLCSLGELLGKTGISCLTVDEVLIIKRSESASSLVSEQAQIAPRAFGIAEAGTRCRHEFFVASSQGV